MTQQVSYPSLVITNPIFLKLLYYTSVLVTQMDKTNSVKKELCQNPKES